MIGLMMLLASGSGDFFYGNDLYAGICGNSRHRLECALYVTGVVDMALTAAAVEKRNLPFCVPRNANVGQLGDVFRKELRDHPKRRHLRGATLVYVSMRDAFPCAV